MELLSFEAGDEPVAIYNGQKLQVVYDEKRNPVTITPNQIFFTKRKLSIAPQMHVKKEDILEQLRKYSKVGVLRSFAMGDAIAALPVIRWLVKELKETSRVIFRADASFEDLFKHETEFDFRPVDRYGINFRPEAGEIVLNFNQVFEWDHSETHPFKNFHRTDILYWLLGVPQKDRTYEYGLPAIAEDFERVRLFLNNQRVVTGSALAFAWKGSWEVKSLRLDKRVELVKALAQNHKVVILDPQRIPKPEGYFEHENVVWALGKPLRDVVVLLSFCQAAIVTDSGAMWLAHVSKTPILALLGATDERVRISHHALYPARAKALSLRAQVGCPEACNETLRWCSGKIPCMKDVSVSQLALEIENALRS